METRPSLPGRKLTILGLFGVNLFPVVGIVTFGWDATVVLVLYWLEAGVVLLREAFESLFAALPTGPAGRGFILPFDELQSKRGSVRGVDWLPPLYPRNVPVALNAVGFVGVLWPLVGIGLYTLATDGLVPPGTEFTVGAAAVTVLARHGATAVESLRTGRYETESAHSMLSQRHAVGLLVLLVPGVLLSDASTSAGVHLSFFLLIVVKTAFDAYEFAVGSADDGSSDGDPGVILGVLDRLGADSIGEESQVELPTGRPTARFSTDERAVRLRAVALGVVYSVVPPAGLALFGGAFLGWVFWGIAPAVVVAAVLVSVTVVARALVEDVRFGHLEYRVYDADVVAYDRLLDAPQWRIPRREISEVTAGTGLLGRWTSMGAGTVRIERRDGESVRLVFLGAPERVADELGRRS